MIGRFFLLLAGVGVMGCTNGGSKFQQGVIEYQIEYPREIQSRPISHLLPERLQVFFSEDKMKLQIKGDLNLFSLDFLALSGGDSCYTVFKMLNRRMLVPLSSEERWFLFSDDQPFHYQVLEDSVRQIAGFQCHKVMISRIGHPTESYGAWFTTELPITGQMMRTPFDQIEGVPLAFEIEYHHNIFRFKAISFSCDPGSEPIALPQSYETASSDDVREMINMILN